MAYVRAGGERADDVIPRALTEQGSCRYENIVSTLLPNGVRVTSFQ